MRNYLVTWYYTRPKGDPECLELLKALETITVWHILDPICCVALVRWDLSAHALGEKIMGYLHRQDQLLVMEISDNNAWYGLKSEETATLYLKRPSLPPPQSWTDSPERTE